MILHHLEVTPGEMLTRYIRQSENEESVPAFARSVCGGVLKINRTLKTTKSLTLDGIGECSPSYL